MGLFRQSARDDLRSVFAAIERELRSLLGLQTGRAIMSVKWDVRINPTAQISWGELVDKITILEINNKSAFEKGDSLAGISMIHRRPV
jgi:hypothetical protein